jgi:hypothetical protein
MQSDGIGIFHLHISWRAGNMAQGLLVYLVLAADSGWAFCLGIHEPARAWNPVRYWPVRQLKMLARLPHEYQTWLWLGHTVPNGDPPEPFAPSTGLCCSLLTLPLSLPRDFVTLKAHRSKTIVFFTLIPLYQEEMELKLQKGTDELLNRFAKARINDVIDPRLGKMSAKRHQVNALLDGLDPFLLDHPSFSTVLLKLHVMVVEPPSPKEA